MIQTNFIWKNTPPKIKHKTLILKHKYCSLKCDNNLQCPLVKRLYDEPFHEWQLFCIKKTFGNNFKFHSNLYYKLKAKFFCQAFIKIYIPNGIHALLLSPRSPLVFSANLFGVISISELTSKLHISKCFSKTKLTCNLC